MNSVRAEAASAGYTFVDTLRYALRGERLARLGFTWPRDSRDEAINSLHA